jgi:hypothetical protein
MYDKGTCQAGLTVDFFFSETSLENILYANWNMQLFIVTCVPQNYIIKGKNSGKRYFLGGGRNT